MDIVCGGTVVRRVRLKRGSVRRGCALVWVSGLAACAAAMQGCTGAIVAASVVGAGIAARSPTDEIEQTYYLGVYDQAEQIPPTLYRVRVVGQSGALNNTKFGSGWVRAELVDSLNSDVKLPMSGTNNAHSMFGSGRRLVMFGPEGFHVAPADHRLVLVMGAKPSAFFSAMDAATAVLRTVEGSGEAGGGARGTAAAEAMRDAEALEGTLVFFSSSRGNEEGGAAGTGTDGNGAGASENGGEA